MKVSFVCKKHEESTKTDKYSILTSLISHDKDHNLHTFYFSSYGHSLKNVLILVLHYFHLLENKNEFRNKTCGK